MMTQADPNNLDMQDAASASVESAPSQCQHLTEGLATKPSEKSSELNSVVPPDQPMPSAATSSESDVAASMPLDQPMEVKPENPVDAPSTPLDQPMEGKPEKSVDAPSESLLQTIARKPVTHPMFGNFIKDTAKSSGRNWVFSSRPEKVFFDLIDFNQYVVSHGQSRIFDVLHYFTLASRVKCRWNDLMSAGGNSDDSLLLFEVVNRFSSGLFKDMSQEDFQTKVFEFFDTLSDGGSDSGCLQTLCNQASKHAKFDTSCQKVLIEVPPDEWHFGQEDPQQDICDFVEFAARGPYQHQAALWRNVFT